VQEAERLIFSATQPKGICFFWQVLFLRLIIDLTNCFAS
jgi:hypothetical protein